MQRVVHDLYYILDVILDLKELGHMLNFTIKGEGIYNSYKSFHNTKSSEDTENKIVLFDV